MEYITCYKSPLGRLTLTADEQGLTGLWMEQQNRPLPISAVPCRKEENAVLQQACEWLDRYFSAKASPITSIPLSLKGTPFQISVWSILMTVPYGATISYGEIARKIATERKLNRMSAQAVGNAVGRNPIAIIIPCHRVIGANGSLTGYAGGLPHKKFLLDMEASISSQQQMIGQPQRV